MSQVETVALWAGLISSVAGIVLSVVAMLFAIWVNNRASEINNQMIRSLQKIESSVERVSTDTRELITAGWNKMLGGLAQEAEAQVSEGSADELLTGLAVEARSNIGEDGHGQNSDPERIEQLERALDDLRESMAVQLKERSLTRWPGSLDLLLGRMSRLPIEARALLEILRSGRHLDKNTYRAGMNDPNLSSALRHLRKAGLLVPLEGFDENEEPTPVYHLPPGMGRQLRIASRLTGDIPEEILSTVRGQLEKHGYVKTTKS